MALDSEGNVYVTGWSYRDSTKADIVTFKYSPEGEELWNRRYNYQGNGYDWGRGIVVDGQGNVYVTGTSSKGPMDSDAANHDYVTIKYTQTP